MLVSMYVYTHFRFFLKLKNNDKIKEILDATETTQKSLKIFTFLHLGNTQHMESQDARIRDVEYAV